MWATLIGTLLGVVLGYVASARVAEKSHRQALERDKKNWHYQSSVAEFREMRVLGTQFRAEWSHLATHLQGDMLRVEPDLAGLHAKADLIRYMAPEMRDIVTEMLRKDVYTDPAKTDDVYRRYDEVLIATIRRMWPENLDENS